MDSLLVNSAALLGWVFGASVVAALVWHVWYWRRGEEPIVKGKRKLVNSDMTKINLGIMLGFGTLGAMVGLLSATVAPTLGGAALPAIVTILLGYLASKPGEGAPTDAGGGKKTVNLLARPFMRQTGDVAVADAAIDFVWVPARILLASLALFWSVTLGYNWNHEIMKADAVAQEDKAAAIASLANQQALDVIWLEKFVIACQAGKEAAFARVNDQDGCGKPRPTMAVAP